MTSAVRRDHWGIAHITGATVMDVAFAQGQAVAEDRTDQIELDRLYSCGRAAEVLGESATSWDVLARRARLADLAERAFGQLDAESQQWFERFVEGVREGLGESRYPGEWEPWSPIGVFAVHQFLFGSFPGKLWRGRFAQVHGVDSLAAFSRETDVWSGSNAWVVDGSRTASGQPIIAGDPHRILETPGCYQQVRLTCDDFDVVGFTFPGVPGIQHFGHAGGVAWAITNAMADYQDLYVERLSRTDDAVTALGPDGPEPVERRLERVEVHGGGVVDVEVLTTARGPVILGGPDDQQALSLATASWELGDLGLGAVLPLLRSNNAADVDRALDHWVEPVNNALIADTSGDVRYRIAGRVPLRGDAARETPVAADDPAVQWSGWVEPPRESPVDGLIVTANERRGADSEQIGRDFAAPARRDRIRALVGSRDDLTGDDFSEIHADTFLPGARAIVDFLVESAPVDAGELRDGLAGWDLDMAAESQGAAVFGALRAALVDELGQAQAFADLGPAPDPVFAPWWDVRVRIGLVLARWIEQGAPFGIDLQASAQAAWLVVVENQQPTTWGEQHRWYPGGLEPVRLPGDSDTVFSTTATAGSDRVYRGPVARYVWDLADREASRWIVPLGAAGDPDDPHHHDQLDHWLNGRLIPVVGPTQRGEAQ